MVGRLAFRARLEPVSEELHFDVNKPVIFEQSLHRRVAHRFGVENEILMNQSKRRISSGRGGLDPFLYREGANLRRPHGIAIAGNRPISREQFDLACHQTVLKDASGLADSNAYGCRALGGRAAAVG
jgi:hypothetical protein